MIELDNPTSLGAAGNVDADIGQAVAVEVANERRFSISADVIHPNVIISAGEKAPVALIELHGPLARRAERIVDSNVGQAVAVKVADQGSFAFAADVVYSNVIMRADGKIASALIELYGPLGARGAHRRKHADVVKAVAVEVGHQRGFAGAADVMPIKVIICTAGECSAPQVELQYPTRVNRAVGNVNADVISTVAVKVTDKGSFAGGADVMAIEVEGRTDAQGRQNSAFERLDDRLRRASAAATVYRPRQAVAKDSIPQLT